MTTCASPGLPGNASRDNSPAVSRNPEIQKIRSELKKRCHPKKGKKKPQTCGICSEKGHNRKTCPQNLLLARKKRNKRKKRQKPTEEEEESQDATWTPTQEHIAEARAEAEENQRRYLKQLSKKRKQRRAHFRKDHQKKRSPKKNKKPKRKEKEKREEHTEPEEIRSLAGIPEAEVPNDHNLLFNAPPVESEHPCEDVLPALMEVCPLSVPPRHIYTVEDLKQCLHIRMCNVLLPVKILGHVVSAQKSEEEETLFRVRMQNVRTGDFTVDDSFSEMRFQTQADNLGKQFSNIDNFAQAMVDVTWRPLKLAYLTKINMDENHVFTQEEDRMVRDSTVESIIANTLCQTNMFKMIMQQLVSVTERLDTFEQIFAAEEGPMMKNTESIRKDMQRVGQAAHSFVSPSASASGSLLFQDDSESGEEDEVDLEWSPENAPFMKYGGKSPKASRSEVSGKSPLYSRPL